MGEGVQGRSGRRGGRGRGSTEALTAAPCWARSRSRTSRAPGGRQARPARMPAAHTRARTLMYTRIETPAQACTHENTHKRTKHTHTRTHARTHTHTHLDGRLNLLEGLLKDLGKGEQLHVHLVHVPLPARAYHGRVIAGSGPYHGRVRAKQPRSGGGRAGWAGGGGWQPSATPCRVVVSLAYASRGGGWRGVRV